MPTLPRVLAPCCLAIAAIESVDKAVLHWFTWFDELECYPMLFGPFRQCDGYQFWTSA